MHTDKASTLAIKVSITTIFMNVMLSAFKLFSGIFSHSAAMISDALHSLSDVFTTIIVIIGVKLSQKASDRTHPYGHERLECVAAVILSGILFMTGMGIGFYGIQKIFSPASAFIPGTLAMIAAIISIISKEMMYWYTRNAAKKLHSSALMADAWHHRSDALSSVGSLIGIIGAHLGFPILDPLAGIIISVFVVKAAVDIFRDAIGKMTDKSCDDTINRAMIDTILSQNGVLGIDRFCTRLFGDKIYVDVEIRADGTLSLYEAHAIAHTVHDSIEHTFSQVKHCMVHVNPAPKSKRD